METSRRDFLLASSTLTAMGVAGTSGVALAQSDAPKTLGALTEHKLPALAYAYDALEPYIDAKTMELHHSKHHAAYVKGLNQAEAELAKARGTGDFALVQLWSKRQAFHGAGHYLHCLFWETMAPNGKGGGGEPQGALAEKIVEDFGSFAAFKAQFTEAAKSVEASGWASLAWRQTDGRLLVLQYENHQKLSTHDSTPLLPLDVWEHAYYLKYQNKRDEYVNAWWNVVNWEAVAAHLAKLK